MLKFYNKPVNAEADLAIHSVDMFLKVKTAFGTQWLSQKEIWKASVDWRRPGGPLFDDDGGEYSNNKFATNGAGDGIQAQSDPRPFYSANHGSAGGINGDQDGGINGSQGRAQNGSTPNGNSGGNTGGRSNLGSRLGFNGGQGRGFNGGQGRAQNGGTPNGNVGGSTGGRSNLGSRLGSNGGYGNGSHGGINGGSGTGSNSGSDGGSGRGSNAGSNGGSGRDSDADINGGSGSGSNAGGSGPGSNAGSNGGSGSGSNAGSDGGSGSGSNAGSDGGSSGGSNNGFNGDTHGVGARPSELEAGMPCPVGSEEFPPGPPNTPVRVSTAWFEVRESVLAGFGAFATQDIKRHQTILIEKALFHANDVTLFNEVENLTPETKQEFNQLQAYYPWSGYPRLLALFRTNR